MDAGVLLKCDLFLLHLCDILKDFQESNEIFGVILLLLISSESLNAMVLKMAALRLWTLEVEEVIVILSSVSALGAIVMMF